MSVKIQCRSLFPETVTALAGSFQLKMSKRGAGKTLSWSSSSLLACPMFGPGLHFLLFQNTEKRFCLYSKVKTGLPSCIFPCLSAAWVISTWLIIIIYKVQCSEKSLFSLNDDVAASVKNRLAAYSGWRAEDMTQS